MGTDHDYWLRWLPGVEAFTRYRWQRWVLDCDEFPWRDWYDAGDTPAQAFARAQQERSVKATA